MKNSHLIKVRQILEPDIDKYFEIRLEGLKLVPQAFGASYEDELKNGKERFANIIKAGNPANIIFGAFEDEALVGCIGVVRESGKKSAHKALIWGMYVRSSHQGKGVGKSLMQKAISHARTFPEIQLINLTVGTENDSAKKLYQSFGFVRWGIEPRGLMVDGVVSDEDHMALILH